LAESAIAAVGVHPARLSDEPAADLLDAVAQMWFTLAAAGARGRQIAFKLLER